MMMSGDDRIKNTGQELDDWTDGTDDKSGGTNQEGECHDHRKEDWLQCNWTQ